MSFFVFYLILVFIGCRAGGLGINLATADIQPPRPFFKMFTFT